MRINSITEVRRNRSQKSHNKAEVTQLLKDGARAQNAPGCMSRPPHSTASIWKDARSSYTAPFLHFLEWNKNTHLSAKTQILVFSSYKSQAPPPQRPSLTTLKQPTISLSAIFMKTFSTTWNNTVPFMCLFIVTQCTMRTRPLLWTVSLRPWTVPDTQQTLNKYFWNEWINQGERLLFAKAGFKIPSFYHWKLNCTD